MFEDHQSHDLVPKLSDFAFSRTWKEKELSGGTEYWNAPECCEFRTMAVVDSQTSLRDLFSLGLVFWNVFHEKRPFEKIGSERDADEQTRLKITHAKETGYLIHELEHGPSYVRNPFDASLNICNKEPFQDYILGKKDEEVWIEANDDADALLTIREILRHLLQPQPENRRYMGNIVEDLRYDSVEY
jgi:serine/threonine protein kinase